MCFPLGLPVLHSDNYFGDGEQDNNVFIHNATIKPHIMRTLLWWHDTFKIFYVQFSPFFYLLWLVFSLLPTLHIFCKDQDITFWSCLTSAGFLSRNECLFQLSLLTDMSRWIWKLITPAIHAAILFNFFSSSTKRYFIYSNLYWKCKQIQLSSLVNNK